MSAATAPGMPLAASSITNLAGAINAVSNAASDHPKIATAAGAAAAAGALAGAGALSYGIANGFGLGATAAALDTSAAALSAAAAELGAAGVAGAAGKAAAGGAAEAAAGAAGGAAAGKASRWARAGKFVKGAAGVVGVGALAEAAQENGVLQAPDTSAGLGRAAVEAADPRLAELSYGESHAAGRQRRAALVGRQIAGIRGSSLPTETGSGRLGFGLNGPMSAPDAVPLGTGGGGPRTGFGASPVDAGAVSGAKAQLASLRTELASLKTGMAATSGLDLPGLGEGIAKRKAEVEGLITGLETRLQSLGSKTVAPAVDTSKVDELSTKLGDAQAKATTLAGTSATPQVGTGPVDGLIAKLGQAIALVGQLEGGVASANAGIAGVNAGALKARSGAGFSDGNRSGRGAE